MATYCLFEHRSLDFNDFVDLRVVSRTIFHEEFAGINYFSGCEACMLVTVDIWRLFRWKKCEIHVENWFLCKIWFRIRKFRNFHVNQQILFEKCCCLNSSNAKFEPNDSISWRVGTEKSARVLRWRAMSKFKLRWFCFELFLAFLKWVQSTSSEILLY